MISGSDMHKFPIFAPSNSITHFAAHLFFVCIRCPFSTLSLYLVTPMAAPLMDNSIMEMRSDLLISAKGGEEPVYRRGYFLKPCSTFVFKPAPRSYLPTSIPDPTNLPLKVLFKGWTSHFQRREEGLAYAPRGWQRWVHRMSTLHHATWLRAGIYDAVINSLWEIVPHRDLVLHLGRRWSPETQTFVFPWGEASLTLEDMMKLGGYSVLGESVSTPIDKYNWVDQRILDGLRFTHNEFAKSPSKRVGQDAWLRRFIDSDDEIEHEAFLALWLSRFVFPSSGDTVRKCLYPLAIHLARGRRIALAPAILSRIYRDLRVLHVKMTEAQSLSNHDPTNLDLWSPLQFVQVWAWERFPALRPPRNHIERGLMSRLHSWDNKSRKIENIGLLIDSAGDSFVWQPYRETESLHENDHAFALSVRVSELVGFKKDCIEQYLPHRVARQFGLDQDLPGEVRRCNQTPALAWYFYKRPHEAGVSSFFPVNYEPIITYRYFYWWNRSHLIAVPPRYVPGCHTADQAGTAHVGSQQDLGIDLNKPYVEVKMDESVAGTSAAMPQDSAEPGYDDIGEGRETCEDEMPENAFDARVRILGQPVILKKKDDRAYL